MLHDNAATRLPGARRTMRLSAFRREWLRYVLPGALLIALLGGGGFAALETSTVDSYWEGLWWALSLVTTVGFLRDAPTTPAGEVLSAVLMVVGFVLLAMTTAAVASLFVREDEEPQERREETFERAVLVELRELSGRMARVEASLLELGDTTPDGSEQDKARRGKRQAGRDGP